MVTKKLRGYQKIPHRLFVEVIITSDCGLVWNHKPRPDPDQICLYAVLRGLKTNTTTYFYQYSANIAKNITMSYQHVRNHEKDHYWHFAAWSEFISSHILNGEPYIITLNILRMLLFFINHDKYVLQTEV